MHQPDAVLDDALGLETKSRDVASCDCQLAVAGRHGYSLRCQCIQGWGAVPLFVQCGASLHSGGVFVHPLTPAPSAGEPPIRHLRVLLLLPAQCGGQGHVDCLCQHHCGDQPARE